MGEVRNLLMKLGAENHIMGMLCSLNAMAAAADARVGRDRPGLVRIRVRMAAAALREKWLSARQS